MLKFEVTSMVLKLQTSSVFLKWLMFLATYLVNASWTYAVYFPKLGHKYHSALMFSLLNTTCLHY